MSPSLHATTVVCVRRGTEVAMAADGQVTMQHSIVKGNVRKVRKIHEGSILVGYAGATADAITLLENLEAQLSENQGQLVRAAVGMAKAWRTDKYMRKMESLMIAADKETSLLISGNGDVIEAEDGILAVGSGGDFARSAAKALLENTDLSPQAICEKAITIAGDICIYTNHNITCESL